MNTKDERADENAPKVSVEQIRDLRSKLSALRGKPLGNPASESVCPDCGGRMIVTNDLDRASATPGMVYVVTRLPGSRCQECGATQLDASGVGILESTIPREIQADYETAVSRTSGTSLGTYFKMDLARVLRLAGQERLYWKVVDQNVAVVRIQREAGKRALRARTRVQPAHEQKKRKKTAGSEGQKAAIEA